ncbi:MAG: glycosyltransferase family 87 protein [Thermoguttaceae bacterium]
MSHWRLSDWTFGFLVALAVMAAWEGFVLNNRPETRGCGGDFPQFYVAGTIISRGEAERLYDQPYFRHFQESMRDDPLRSLYPPTMGLLMAPLARLSYDKALAAWWAIQAVCVLGTGVIFYRTAPLAQPWRINMLVALAALVPLWIAVGIGHLAPILLLILASGLRLHKQGKHGWAGFVLSILALKPQLAAGLVLWMFLRRDFRTLLGLAAGFALQALTVAVFLGPGLWLDYLHAMPAISAITRAYRYSPMFEQSFAGIASNLLWAAGLTEWQVPAMKVSYAVTASAAAVMLCRVVSARRPWQSAQPAVPGTADCEYACGVLFMMILPPYFLVYDQTLLAVPLVMLWSSPAWRWGVALLAATTVLVANLSFTLGFSLTGFVALATMFSLVKTASCKPELEPRPIGAMQLDHGT